MLNKEQIKFKNKILKETKSEKINDLLVSNRDIGFLELFSDSEFMGHLKKYFKLSGDESSRHVYIRKVERKDIDTYK